jgi:hypothetical protein
LTEPRSLVMSQLHTWLGPVASSSGWRYPGWRSWWRRSWTSAVAARTRYIVRSNHAPTAPGVVQAAASWRIRRFYSAVYDRRRGFATTYTSAATPGTSTRASMGSCPLALYSNFRRTDYLTHLDTEGTEGGPPITRKPASERWWLQRNANPCFSGDEHCSDADLRSGCHRRLPRTLRVGRPQ